MTMQIDFMHNVRDPHENVYGLNYDETMLVCDALFNHEFDEVGSKRDFLITITAFNIAHENLDVRWECDGDVLMKRLRELTEEDASELLDKIKAYWDSPHDDMTARLYEVGLVSPAAAQTPTAIEGERQWK